MINKVAYLRQYLKINSKLFGYDNATVISNGREVTVQFNLNNVFHKKSFPIENIDKEIDEYERHFMIRGMFRPLKNKQNAEI